MQRQSRYRAPHTHLLTDPSAKKRRIVFPPGMTIPNILQPIQSGECRGTLRKKGGSKTATKERKSIMTLPSSLIGGRTNWTKRQFRLQIEGLGATENYTLKYYDPGSEKEKGCLELKGATLNAETTREHKNVSDTGMGEFGILSQCLGSLPCLLAHAHARLAR